MGSNLFVWLWHPQFELHYHYDARTDSLVFENGQVLKRPPNISGDYLLAHQRSVLAADPRVLRTVPHYPTAHNVEQTVVPNAAAPSYAPASARFPEQRPEMAVLTNAPLSPIRQQISRSELPTNQISPPISPAALTKYMNSMSMTDASRRSSYHAPVSQTFQSAQANMMKVYTTPAGIVRSTPPGLESIPESEAKLYASFRKKVKTRKFFVVGKVFLTLWTEPAGDVGSNYTAITSGLSVGPFGESIYSKIRRFVVVRAGEHSCTAVPVLTYGHQGVGKAGVQKNEHAIIYTGRDPPMPLPKEKARRGEEGMLLPIRVDPDDASHKLDPSSRINFGKVYSIEHNVKVSPFGKVNATSTTALLYQFKAVWEKNFPGIGSQLQIKTPQGVQTDTAEASDSPQQADLMRAQNILLSNGFTTKQVKGLLHVGFQLPRPGVPTEPGDEQASGAVEEDDDDEISDEADDAKVNAKET